MRATVLACLLLLTACDQPKTRTGVPAPTADGKPVPVRSMNMVLNGDFAHGTDHWAVAGMGAGASTDAGRSAMAGDQGLSLHVTSHTVPMQLAIQDVAVLDTIAAATFRVSYRMGGTATSQLQGLQLGVGALVGNDFQPVVRIDHSMQNLPKSGWVDVSRTLDKPQRDALATLRNNGARVVVWVQLAGTDVALHVDNVSLEMTGTRSAGTVPGTLAYTAQEPDQPYRIETASPDGRTRKVLFTAPSAQAYAKGLAWSPDRSRLLFASDHEMAWSPFTADLYDWTPSGVTRLTNGPSQATLMAKGLPTGGVTIKIRNLNTFAIGPVAIYVQGTRVLGSVSLGPLATEEVTLPEVADLGVGVPQTLVARIAGRSVVAAGGVDIEAGRTITAPGEFSIGSLHDQQVTQPHFHKDGTHVVVSFAGLRTVPVSGGLPATERLGSLIGSDPAYAPHDGSLLYAGMGGIWLLREGASQAEQVVAHPSGGLATSPAWLPDGSGFVYAAAAMHPTLQTGATQIFLQRLDGTAPTQLTDGFDLHASDLVVSPDGKYVAMRRAGVSGTYGVLWVMPIDAPHRGWLVPTPGSIRFITWR